jgi:hypothetical protein
MALGASDPSSRRRPDHSSGLLLDLADAEDEACSPAVDDLERARGSTWRDEHPDPAEW